MVRPGPQARDSDDAEASEEEDGSGEEEEGEEDGCEEDEENKEQSTEMLYGDTPGDDQRLDAASRCR